MASIFSNVTHAQRAIPETGNGWSDARLKSLGERVKSRYPELAARGPQLVGEAHLLYVATAKRLDERVSVIEDDPRDRSEAFLSFLVERLEHTPI
ncbi:hypothetical protein [Paraburkholderia tropica]|uniref:hypothetical protein n=1 Tax=Paraburkholderia tropica TaxID=92647 RepID=UPI002AB5FA32|nr:hypothetical protein [Paraburkholderia tropica]